MHWPRRLLRRLLTVPALIAAIPVAVLLLGATALVQLPLLLLGDRRARAVRLAAFLLLYLLVDACGLVAACVIGLRRPPVRAELDQRLLVRLLGVLHRGGARLFRLRLRVDPDPATRCGGGTGRPLLVLARHAGLGDSFLLVEQLAGQAGYRPRIVLKRLLRLDPCLDVLLGRSPACFVPPEHADRTLTAQRIGELAAGLGAGEALVLFPEGGKFTERRRARAIRSLRRNGERERAERAGRHPHVLPPRTAGALAALAAAPGADVVFAAHTGLDAMDSVRATWRALPLARPVRARWWRVPAHRVPAEPAAREAWLLAQWDRVDAWIAAERQAEGT
ncbi:hypothetical protein ACFYNO_17215 [Kitasatospora sp. NPDC006697]|uniref:hypothetical protein n=1 Tax=Kitasatospora sp. NPDC006697 TaxID=3364020 RepID=UPI00367EF37C